MMRIYKRLLPEWKDYLTFHGTIDLKRLAQFFSQLAPVEGAMFRQASAVGGTTMI